MSANNIRFEYYFGDVDIINIPDNVAVRDGVVTLTGGYDHQGRPVVVFPLEMNLSIQMSQVTEVDLVDAIIYYWNTIRVPDKSAGLAFLVDFRAGSVIIIDTIISTINRFKSQYSMSVGSVYIIRPQEADLCNRLKLQLGLKKSNFFSKLLFSHAHSFKCTAQFECILLKSSSELGKYIEIQCLTYEFGGSLSYDHTTWLQLKMNTDAYLKDIIRIKSTFPDAEERIRLLNEYEKPESELLADEAIGWIRRRFDEIVSNIGLDDIFLETDQILMDLSPSADDGNGSSKYRLMKGNQHLDNYRMLINAIRAKLVEVQNHFQTLLEEVEKKIKISDEFKEVKNFNGETVKWIHTFGIPLLEAPPKIASNLNEAESVARDFHNQLFVPGMKSIAKCEDICKSIQNTSMVHGTGDELVDRSQYLQKLQLTLNTFNNNLQSRRKLYSDVYQFHLILSRVISWLKRSIKSLPLDLVNYQENMADSDPLPFGTVWKTSIHQYLLRHPAPKSHQVELIEKLTPMMKDLSVRNEARLLTYRLKVVMKLMQSRDVTVADVREVIEWRYRLQADAQTDKKKDQSDEGDDHDEDRGRVTLFKKFELQNMNASITDKEEDGIVKTNQYHKNTKTFEHSKARTSPHYSKNKGHVKTNQLSQSQPKINIKVDDYDRNTRTKELISLAEKTVRDSLEDTHLISEKDLRVNCRMRDEEELSLILNQLLYDINSQHDSNSRKTSRNPSSLRDLSTYTDFPDYRDRNNLRNIDYY